MTAVKLEFESCFRAIKHGNSEIWRYNVDLGQNCIFYAPNEVYFSMWFIQLTAGIFEMPVVASHGTEPGVVIKFNDSSSHPGTHMLQNLIKPTAIDKLMTFLTKIYRVMLQYVATIREACYSRYFNNRIFPHWIPQI